MGQRGLSHARWLPLGWLAVAVVLLLIVAMCLQSDRGQPNLAQPRQPTVRPPSTSASWPSAEEPDSPTSVARSVPVALRIPAIGVSVSLSSLGLNPDGTVEVPTNFPEPGWFHLGPSPGQLGSAVILGHVDSYRGPAVFYRLRFLQGGDQVDVTLVNGVVAHFVVTAVATYPKDRFPARQVYGSHGYSALQLVTCGGAFDSRTRSYLSNVVVYSSLVGTTPSS